MSTKIFIHIVYILSFVNILEGVTWSINGLAYPWNRQISFVLNTMLLMCVPLPAVAWLAYVDYSIFNNIERMKKRLKVYLIPFYIPTILIIVNIWTGIVFTINASNGYSRGPGVTVIALMTYAMITGLYFRTRSFKKQINGKIMHSIFLFMLIPIMAGIIQMLVYGILVIWPSFIFATLIAFFQIEKEVMSQDSLTGLATRANLERRVQYLINKNIGFSIIMLDMNDFKSINDQYGHHEGDQALITMASILRHNVKIYDLICRYGGDEFVILIETDNKGVAKEVSRRVGKGLEVFNQKNIKPYRMSVSSGYAYWDPTERKSLDEILRAADSMMYECKVKH
jgi:diguanylate cyclase (GGDEF)-like protein